jgi:hypothetical protein
MENGTADGQANYSLMQLVEEAFAGDTHAAALALGREPEQIQEILTGDAFIDEDLDMKVQLLARERLDSTSGSNE